MEQTTRTLELRPLRRNLDYDAFVKRSAVDTDYDVLISHAPTLFTFDGEPIGLYAKAPPSAARLPAMLRDVRYDESTRSAGLKTRSRVFGFQPRVAMRRDFCTSTSLTYTNPEVNTALCEVGKDITEIYKTFFPEILKRHAAMTKRVLSEWTMPGTVFTSGIVNKNNPLKYHYDAGNFQNVSSCMLGFRHGIKGGYLCMPEYGMALEIADQSLTVFDGQKILHGVTPITAVARDATRFTVVYYSLKGMWRCEPLTQEIARIRAVKLKRELKRLDTAIVDQHGERK